MNAALRMRQYQQQAVVTSSPELLIIKIYDFCVASCHRNDRTRLRQGLVHLIGSLNFEGGGEIAQRLHAIYLFCLNESIAGDLQIVREVLEELRDTWKEGVLIAKAA